MINIGNITIENLYIGNLEVKEAWLGNIKVYPNESSEFKFRLTYADGSVFEKKCETDETITRDEIDNFENITNVVIGNCVSRIGVGAFSNCSGLTSVDIPSGVTNIGESAFEGCSSLTSVTVEPTTPPTLSDKAFDNTNDCPIYVPNASVDAYKTNWSNYADRIQPMSQEYEGFCRLTLSGGSVVEIQGSGELTASKISNYQSKAVKAEVGTLCTSLGQSVFMNFSKLSSVTISDSVTSIGNQAFQSLKSLTSVSIGDNVTSIGNQAFQRCSGLTSIDIPSSVTSIGDYAFSECKGFTNITIPSNVTSIGGYAFSQCSGLTSIVIPNSVTTIGGNAFNNCSSLTSITVEPTTPPTLSSSPFDNTNNCPIYVPSQSVETYKTASVWYYYTNRIQAIA